MFPKPEPRKKRRGRAPGDRVDPALHRAVLLRDRKCIGYRRDPTHVCTNTWGRVHSPFDLDELTNDHVWVEFPGGVKGDRAPSDLLHLVAACHGLNVGVPSSKVREFEREYLLDLYGEGAYPKLEPRA